MSRYSTGGKMLEDARQKASQSFDSSFSFASWKDGETKIVRFLHGMDNMFIFKHECGADNFEMGATAVNETTNSGQAVLCPVCEKPLNVSPAEEGGDIIALRPGIIGVPTHSAISPKDGVRRTFVCLDGTEYDCPICKIINPEKNKQQYPARNLYYGSAVVREGKEEKVVVSGIPTLKIVGVEDSYRTTDGGDKVLDVILLSQSWGNFWSVLDNVMMNQGSVAYYDFLVTRHGQKLDTKFHFEKLQSEPTPVPFSQYADAVPDVTGFLDNSLGHPSYYEKHGFPVVGYVAEKEEAEPKPEQQSLPVQEPAESKPEPAAAAPAPQAASTEAKEPTAFEKAAAMMSSYTG